LCCILDGETLDSLQDLAILQELWYYRTPEAAMTYTEKEKDIRKRVNVK
jgi:hypothetical protein